MRSTNQNGACEQDGHEQSSSTWSQKIGVVPHWNALLALVALGVLYPLLPDTVSISLSWLLLSVE